MDVILNLISCIIILIIDILLFPIYFAFQLIIYISRLVLQMAGWICGYFTYTIDAIKSHTD